MCRTSSHCAEVKASPLLQWSLCPPPVVGCISRCKACTSARVSRAFSNSFHTSSTSSRGRWEAGLIRPLLGRLVEGGGEGEEEERDGVEERRGCFRSVEEGELYAWHLSGETKVRILTFPSHTHAHTPPCIRACMYWFPPPPPPPPTHTHAHTHHPAYVPTCTGSPPPPPPPTHTHAHTHHPAYVPACTGSPPPPNTHSRTHTPPCIRACMYWFPPPPPPPPQHTLTHTHTTLHTCLHVLVPPPPPPPPPPNTHSRTHTPPCIRACMYWFPPPPTHTRTHTPPCIRACMYWFPPPPQHTLTHTHITLHTCLHVLVPPPTHTHAHTHHPAYVPACTGSPPPPPPPQHTLTHTHTTLHTCLHVLVLTSHQQQWLAVDTAPGSQQRGSRRPPHAAGPERCWPEGRPAKTTHQQSYYCVVQCELWYPL